MCGGESAWEKNDERRRRRGRTKFCSGEGACEEKGMRGEDQSNRVCCKGCMREGGGGEGGRGEGGGGGQIYVVGRVHARRKGMRGEDQSNRMCGSPV